MIELDQDGIPFATCDYCEKPIARQPELDDNGNPLLSPSGQPLYWFDGQHIETNILCVVREWDFCRFCADSIHLTEITKKRADLEIGD
jgi:hypothetical protein